MTTARELAIRELQNIEAQEEMLFIKRSFGVVDMDASQAQLDRLYDRRVAIRRQGHDITLADVANVDRRKADRRAQ